MTLTSAIRTANSALASQSQQISNISRNISGIGDPNYVRRQTDVYTAAFGATRVETQRTVDHAVYTASISSRADSEYAAVLAKGLDNLAALQGKENFLFSPSKLLGDLQQMVEFAAASPSDSAALTTLVESARTTADALNASYDEILTMRRIADKEITQSVAAVNSLLAQIKVVNDEVVNGTLVGKDPLDSMDERDRLVAELSQEIGIKVISEADNNIIITTKNGTLLFENNPRAFTFQSTPSYGPLTAGGHLQIDGVTVTGPNAKMGLDSGKIAGQFELRDNLLLTQQNQLDEIARGLVELFAETDQTGGAKPPVAGLFTWAGGPTVPVSGALENGIASTITLNPLADPSQGGDPAVIRDGSINGDPDYLYNTANNVGFSDRLFDLAAAFDTATSFDGVAGLPTNQSLNGYASSAVDSLNSKRASALTEQEYRSQLASQFKLSLQSQTGPNLDFEMSRLLEVERAYQASAQMLKTVDELFGTLLSAVS